MKQLSQHIVSMIGSSIFGEPCGLSFEPNGIVSGYTEI